MLPVVVLGAPPPIELGFPLPAGTRLAWSAAEARLPGRGRFDPDVLLVLHRARDGTVLLQRETDDRRAILSLVGPEGERGSWTTDRTVGEAAEVDGRWFVQVPRGLEVRDGRGGLVATVTVPCDRAPSTFAVDGGLYVICDGRGSTVGPDGAVTEGPATLTLPSGRVLEVDPRGLSSDGWSVALDTPWVTPSPDGRFLWVGRAVLDAETGETRAEGSYAGWTPDGELLDADHPSAIRHDPATGRPRRTVDGHAVPIEQLAWSDDGRLASVDWDGVVLVWDPAGGPPRHRLELAPPVHHLALADGAIVAAGHAGTFVRHVLGEAAPRYVAAGWPTAWSAGRVVALRDEVAVLDPDGRELSSWACPLLPPAEITQVALAGDRIVALCADGLFDVATGELLVLGARSVEPTADGEAILICDRVWGTTSWPPGHRGVIAGCDGADRGLSIASPRSARSPDGRLVATARSDGAIEVRPTAPIRVERAPRDIVIVAAPGTVDVVALVEGLRWAAAKGDRITWVAPGIAAPRWIRLADRHAAADLASLGATGTADPPQREICRAQQVLADGGRDGLVLVFASSGGPRCPAQRDAATRFVRGVEQALGVAGVLPVAVP